MHIAPKQLSEMLLGLHSQSRNDSSFANFFWTQFGSRKYRIVIDIILHTLVDVLVSPKFWKHFGCAIEVGSLIQAWSVVYGKILDFHHGVVIGFAHTIVGGIHHVPLQIRFFNFKFANDHTVVSFVIDFLPGLISRAIWFLLLPFVNDRLLSFGFATTIRWHLVFWADMVETLVGNSAVLLASSHGWIFLHSRAKNNLRISERIFKAFDCLTEIAIANSDIMHKPVIELKVLNLLIVYHQVYERFCVFKIFVHI